MSPQMMTPQFDLKSLPYEVKTYILRRHGITPPADASIEKIDYAINSLFNTMGISDLGIFLNRLLAESETNKQQKVTESFKLNFSQPPPFLQTPGKPNIQFCSWINLFKTTSH